MNPLEQTLDDIEYIEIANVSAAAGNGYFILENIADKKYLPVPKSTMKEYGLQPNYTVVVPVKGSSMEPTVADGCLVLVDTTPIENVKLVHNKVYVISVDDLCYIKRFKLMPRSKYIKAESDNRDFASADLIIAKELTDDNLKIIGKLACVVKSSYRL
ncbi:MAG: phage repressor protein [Burkholderiales bacterium]|nr:phage repressor protein [Burkholderiales bacterium]